MPPFAGPVRLACARLASAVAATAACLIGGAAVAGSAPVTPAVPASCRAAVSLVLPDGGLSIGVLQGGRATMYATGSRLGYTPRALAYLGATAAAQAYADRFLAVAADGALHRITVVERRGAGDRVQVRDEVVAASGWDTVRSLAASGTHLYALTVDGQLRRHPLGRDHTPASGRAVGGSIWGSVTGLAFAGTWRLPGGAVADDLVGVRADGSLVGYVVPRQPGGTVTSTALGRGFGGYVHVGVGECIADRGRPLLAVTGSGDAVAYLDADAGDQRGTDIRRVGRVAAGWVGLVTD